MKSSTLERKLERIIFDLQDLAEEIYLDSQSREEIEAAVKELKRISPYSTDL